MNSMLPLPATPPQAQFEAACSRLNQWRGQMVENFARSEQAATETLALLNTIKAEGKGARFPHLVGQRYDRLQDLLSATPAPSGHVKLALTALARFRTHDGLRSMLCHGVTKVAIDRPGKWVALISLLNFRAGAAVNERRTLLEAEGATLLEQVTEARKMLCTALGQVRREISKVDELGVSD